MHLHHKIYDLHIIKIFNTIIIPKVILTKKATTFVAAFYPFLLFSGSTPPLLINYQNASDLFPLVYSFQQSHSLLIQPTHHVLHQ